MDRREFLTTSLALATLPGTNLLAQDVPAGADGRIAVGFFGGSHSHGLGKAKVLLEQPETWNIIGILEESDAEREEYAKLGIKAIDEEELLANAQVIFVESDVKDHYRHGKTVLSSGKHLHLEKPPTMTLVEFQELEAIATSKKVLMQMGYMWRFNPGIMAALDVVRQGWLGEVYLVKAEIGKLQSATDRLENSFPGGTMFELGCHVIDPIVRMLGRPTKVNAYNKTSGDYGDQIEDNTIAVLDYPKATAIVGSTILHHSGSSHRQLHIYGTNGNALVRPLDRPVLELDLHKAIGPYQRGKQTIEFPPYRRYVGEIQELANAIRNKGTLGVTPEMDLIVHETLLRACGLTGEESK